MIQMDKLTLFIGLQELKRAKFYKAVVCEFLATAILMLFVCASSVTMNNGKPTDTFTGAFCSAMTVAYIVWTFNHVSGAHINPVITLCFLVTGQGSLTKLVVYTIAQCAGAITGSAVTWYLVPATWRGTLSSTMLSEEVTVAQGFGAEALCTFTLMLGVYATGDQFRDDHSGSMSLTIGLIVFIESAWAGKLTGCSMNPARTLGPAVMAGTWENHWIYWVAPAVGGVAGSLVYQHFIADSPKADNISISISVGEAATEDSKDQQKTEDSKDQWTTEDTKDQEKTEDTVDQRKSSQRTIIIEDNITLAGLRRGFDNLALELDTKS